MEPRNFPKNNWNVICDICGRKIRRKEAVLVTDKFSTYYNFLVCKKDFDKTNPQANLKAIKEDIKLPTKYVRPPPPDYYAPDSPDVLPSAPLNVTITPDTLESQLFISWQPPIITGGRIIGYRIRRASPQLGGTEIIEDDTGLEATYFVDATADLSSEYTYEVAAINNLGVGAYSAPGFYPYVIDGDIGYLLTSDTEEVITVTIGGVDYYLRLHPQ